MGATTSGQTDGHDETNRILRGLTSSRRWRLKSGPSMLWRHVVLR